VVLAGVCIVGILGCTIGLLTRPKPVVPAPPEVVARHELEPLRQQPETGAVLSRVSQVLRRYLASAFSLPPGEMTTTEFCREISAQERVGAKLASDVSEFLKRCDVEKFAPPGAVAPIGAVARATDLIGLAEGRRAELRAQEAAPQSVAHEGAKAS
jgi:hypothetical protein